MHVCTRAGCGSVCVTESVECGSVCAGQKTTLDVRCASLGYHLLFFSCKLDWLVISLGDQLVSISLVLRLQTPNHHA